MIYHALVKSALFLSAGNVFLRYGSTKIANVRGMVRVLPITGILFLIGLFVITGTPPFGMFFIKVYILAAGIHEHPAATIAAIFLVALLFIGFLKQVIAMAFGEKPAGIADGERKGLLTAAPLALLTIVVFLGFHLPAFLKALVTEAARRF